jgi:hypothetical protein
MVDSRCFVPVNSHLCPSKMGLGWSQSQSGGFGEENPFFPLLGIEAQFLRCSVHSPGIGFSEKYVNDDKSVTILETRHS